MPQKRSLSDRSNTSDIDPTDLKKNKEIRRHFSENSENGNMAEVEIDTPGEDIVSLTSDQFTRFFKNALADPAIRDELADISSMRLLKKIEKQDKEIKDLRRQVNNLSDSLDELQQYSRRNSVRIAGIPETPGENTDDIVIDVANRLIGTNINIDNIDRSHRVGKPNQANDKPRVIIVKLTSYKVREKLIKGRKNLRKNPESKSIYINEDLTSKRANLARRARDLSKDKPEIIASTWTFDGRIYIQETPHHGGSVRCIKSEDDLEKYLRLNISAVTSTPRLSQRYREDNSV